MRFLIFIFALFFSILSFSQIAGTFSGTGLPIAQDSWNNQQDVIVPVTGMTSPLATGSIELIQANIEIQSTSNISTSVAYKIISPNGTEIILKPTGYNGPGSVKHFDIKFRDPCTQGGCDWFTSITDLAGFSIAEPWSTGFHRPETSCTFDDVNGENPNGNWIVRFNETSNFAEPAIVKVELIFGLLHHVDITNNPPNEDCSNPHIFCEDYPVCYDNSNMTGDPSTDPAPGFGGCAWNLSLDNTGWFSWVASSTTAHIEVSGLQNNQQIIAVGNSTGYPTCDANDLYLLDGGCPTDPVNHNPGYSNGDSHNIELNISNLTIGETYYFVFDGDGGNTTHAYLTIEGAETCIVICDITDITTNTTCPDASNQFTVSGDITFVNAPATGTLTITDDISGLSQTFNAPFNTNPQAYSISGIPYDGNQHTLTATFSDGTACTMDVNYTPINKITPTFTPVAAICSGDALSALPTTSNNGISGIWSPALDNTATTTYTFTPNAGECATTTSLTITVNPKVTPTFTPVAAICSGDALSALPTSSNNGISGTWSPALDNTATTTYTFTPNAGECATSTTMTITVNDAVTVSNIQATCGASQIDYTVTFDIFGGDLSTYVVTPLGSGTLTGSSFTSNTINSGTAYSFTVTDANGCSPVVVSGNHSCNCPVVGSISGNASICVGESTDLTFDYSGGTAPYDLVYSDGTNNFNLNGQTGTSTNVSVSPTSTTTYTLVSVNDINCSGTTSGTATITVNSLPTANAGTDDAICLGQTTAQLTASGGVSYAWDNGVSLTSTTINNPIASPTSTTTYTVTVTDGNSCTNTDNVTITVNGIPTANAGSDQDLCSGFSATLDASASTGTAPLTYTWDHGLGNGITQSVSPVITTNYNVSVTDANGCLDTDGTNINVIQPPTVSAGQDVTICEGETSQLNATGGVTYLWDNGTSLTSTTINNPIASPTSTTTYTVTISNAAGCSTTDDVTVTVNPTPNASAGNDVSICEGESTTLIASGGVTYTWDIPANGASQTVSPNVTTIYNVTVSDGSSTNCSATSQVTVTVNPLPVITINPNPVSACSGHPVTLTASGASTYNWSPSTGLSAITGSSVDANPSSNTNYTVIGTSTFGCTASNTVQVDIKDFNVTASPDQTICAGSSTNIYVTPDGGTAPITYYWDNTASSQTITVNPTNGTTYNVYAVDVTGCQSNTDSVTISLYDKPNIEIFANTDTVCPGDPVMLTFGVYGGLGAPYTITNENGDIVTPPVYVYPNNSESYIYFVQDNCPAVNSDTVLLNTYQVPDVSFSADILSGCQPLTVIFNSINEHNNYYWTFTNGNNSSYLSLMQNPTIVFEEDGAYDVSLSVESEDGCKSEETISSMITVYPKPDAKFEVSESVVSYINANVDFYNYSDLNYNNYWSFGDGEQSNIINPLHKYLDIGTYYPVLVVESDKGCLDTAIHEITVQDEFTIYVPTAFSPDKDGINDGFKAVGHGIDLDNYYMAVYDRWGEIIWETTDFFEEWDGRAKNKELVQIGSYVWLYVCKDFNGVEHTKSGNVTVVR